MKAPDRVPPGGLAAATADILARLRERHPRVHCITNAVAQSFTANILLAAGAVPSMTIAAEEVAAFVRRADALLVNLGTFDAERRRAVEAAIAAAREAGKPWVLDPVFIDRSPQRAAFARTLATQNPAAIRLNAAELAALADRADPEPEREAHARATVIGLTGARDLVTDGARQVVIANGDPLMAQVTAMGCAASALVAAAIAVEPDALTATAAAIAAFGVAGEIAAERSRGPGSFAVEIIDALHGLDAAALHRRMRTT
jgi:hydroxyethylthiazole kinase